METKTNENKTILQLLEEMKGLRSITNEIKGTSRFIRTKLTNLDDKPNDESKPEAALRKEPTTNYGLTYVMNKVMLDIRNNSEEIMNDLLFIKEVIGI